MLQKAADRKAKNKRVEPESEMEVGLLVSLKVGESRF